MNPHSPGPHKNKQDRSLSLRQDPELQLTVEFSTVEEMLRHDAAQVEVPPGVGSRLRSSLERARTNPRPWWRKMFGLAARSRGKGE